MQDQDLTRIQSRSGVVKEQTPLAATNAWVDADKVRFRSGKPEIMGGWQNVTVAEKTAKLKGVPRLIETVRTLDDNVVAVLGTNIGVFSTELSDYYNITPLVSSEVSTNVLTTQTGSTRVVVSIPNHGLVNETLVGIVSAATTIGGNILINSVVSVERLFVVSVISADAFEIDTSTIAAATSAATGGAITLKYYLNAGTSSNIYTAGYGTDVYGGDFGYGEAPAGGVLSRLRLWAFDLWGTDVVATPRSGALYIWKPSTAGIQSQMVIVTAAPSVNNIVRVASEQRHILLYGTHDTSGTFDPLLIRWCSQENYDDWTPTNINTSGEYRLNSRGSEIISVTKMADKQIILTDADLFVQSYIGPSDVFGFTRAGDKCGAIGQNGATEYAGALYWMSVANQFYRFDGQLRALPCTVLRYVFDNLDQSQREKIVCGSNAQFDEVVWFYVSVDSPDGEPDKYVIYNTVEDHWTIGNMRRTAWIDRSTIHHPLATGGGGEGLFYHEIGYTADGSPMAAYVESSYFIRNDGNTLLFTNKFAPDFSNILNGGQLEGSLNITLHARKYPNGPVMSKGPYTITGSTQKISTRLRGRQFSYRFSSYGDKPWRQGDFFMSLQLDGER